MTDSEKVGEILKEPMVPAPKSYHAIVIKEGDDRC